MERATGLTGATLREGSRAEQGLSPGECIIHTSGGAGTGPSPQLVNLLSVGRYLRFFLRAATIAALIGLLFFSGHGFAQQPAPEQAQAPKPKPLTFTDRMKQYLRRTGSTIDEGKSTPDMVVSNYPDAKGGKLTIVLVNDRRRNLLGFYIYNFGSLKDVANREEVYKYLLSANDAITIGSFFVDSDEDIGYKYLVSGGQAMSQAAFESAYITMAAVARERRGEIRKLIEAAGEKGEKSSDVKKAAEEKPPKS